MNVLVVGNGIDISLGYPTRLNDCGRWLRIEAQSNPHIKKELDNVNKYYDKDYLFKGDLWSELESNLIRIKPSLKNSVKPWHDDPWSNISHLFRLWVNHICKYVDINKPKINDHIEYNLLKQLVNNADLIISFNYTNTLENYFNVSNNKVIHIHIDDNGLPVLGHKVLKKYNVRNKSCQSFDTESEKWPDDWFSKHKLTFETITNVSEISFLGLSYGSVDWRYYDDLNNMYLMNMNDKNKHFFSNSCIANLYYHGDDSKTKAKRFAKYLIDKSIISSGNCNYLKDNDSSSLN